jgi:gamma-tubulin complex component 5
VASQLDGLEEKFRVYNEDLLADALRERLDLLERKQIKLAPEMLHLLLELSYKPVSNPQLKELEFLGKPDLDIEPALRWNDLIAEDPLLREQSVWENVDFAAGSSEDEFGFCDSRSERSSTDTTVQSSTEDFNRRPEDYFVDVVDKADLERLRRAQFWKKTPSIGGIKLETVKRSITELQATREVVFMLSGLPTALFEMVSDLPTFVTLSKGYALKHASIEAFQALLLAFAKDGSAISILRRWVKRPQSIPLIQIFQSSLSERLDNLDAILSAIQRRISAIEEDTVVSLLRLRAEVDSKLQHLSRLSKIVEQLESERYPHAFRYLEMLYDEVCTSQMAGDELMYDFVGNIFFDCFQVYLRPLRTWMEDGELNHGDKVFFVSEIASDLAPASVWQSRYKMRQTEDGILHAPRFLRALANKIFTTGKSVVVLKHLTKSAFPTSSSGRLEPILDFATVCDPSQLHLVPFPELFDAAFDAWVQSKHHLASSTLLVTLFDSCGLFASLDAVSKIYFMASGCTAATFTNSVFNKLDTLDPSWNDRFTLTELAQSTFGSLPSVSADRLRTHIKILPQKVYNVAKCRRSVKTLSAVELGYNLSWPVQMIITSTTISSYQRVFTFLFQIRRSSHILSRSRLIDNVVTRTSSSDDSALYYSLRTRLIWFTQTLYYYLVSLVIEPNSLKMRQQLNNAEDVDALIRIHATYIKSVIDQALLGSNLQLIHKTILKILDLAIEVKDAQAANAASNKDTEERQQEMMDLSMASFGLHTPQKWAKIARKPSKKADHSSSDKEGNEINVNLSILSSPYNIEEDELYVDKLRKIKANFDRLGRFVASGLRGVARATGGQNARSWDILGEMLESGFESGTLVYR